ncbi:MAG: hypothetical protein ACAH88_12450 [Roseimicrobium sp.]
MELTRRNWNAFEHSRWRVNFVNHLLEIHGRSATQETEEWIAEEAAYRDRLEKAREELALYPVEWLEMHSPPLTDG